MKPVIFVDLDGVLCGFVQGVLRHHGRTDIPISSVRWNIETQLGITAEQLWGDKGFDFWVNLDPLPDGMELLRLVEGLVGVEQIGLLSSPCDTVGCREGKQQWVNKHLPQYRKRLFLGSAKELFAGPTKVLVDDYDGNAQRFYRAGGWSILPARPWNCARDRCDENGNFDVGYTFGLVEKAVGFITN